ncbi:MAG: bifunctional (p)ppGpp synthetase/guanosine-3',5'-bis(diphosphate) 3'-pyrophosphohydrolase, partial [Duodenibacillus sp.]|nr:bifunctional (p)ppGpp synthetase/guanosine-3',5'-bis(diphosphate) 3'-pyrophosphohydrolase [Duodenibacillus sp.]
YRDSSADSGELQEMVNAWLQSLLEIQRTSSDSAEFLENVKIDLFPDRVYVFTPRSRIISLPQGSCPLDFAYQIHTDVGNKTIGCKINGESKPLSTQLKNGDMVEIITGPKAQPDPAWLTYVRSGKARAEVRQFLRSLTREEAVQIGYKALIKAAQESNLEYHKVSPKVWDNVLKEISERSYEDLCADVGLGNQFAAAVIARIVHILDETKKKPAGASVMISGTEGVAVQLASCCHPLPGDKIWGHMRKGHGLAVHRADCEHSVRGQKADPQHWMEIGWKTDAGGAPAFPVPLEFSVDDERQALAEIASELAKNGSAIVGMTLEGESNGVRRVRLLVRCRGRLQLAHLARALKNSKSVKAIERCLDGDKRQQL